MLSIGVRLSRGRMVFLGGEARAWEAGAFYLLGGGSVSAEEIVLGWPVARDGGTTEDSEDNSSGLVVPDRRKKKGEAACNCVQLHLLGVLQQLCVNSTVGASSAASHLAALVLSWA